MFTLIASLHIVICFMLIVLVLIQDSKGGTGMFSGGSSQSILGATGGATLLAKMTRVLAILFAISCILLTIYTSRKSVSVVDGAALPPPTTTNAVGTTPPADTQNAESQPAGQPKK